MLTLILSPFWAATGLFPKNRLALYPESSWIAANIAYLVCAVFRHATWPIVGSPHDMKILTGITVNWILVMMFAHPRWQVAILLAWAATDVIAITTGFSSYYWDWSIFAIYCFRSFIDLER